MFQCIHTLNYSQTSLIQKLIKNDFFDEAEYLNDSLLKKEPNSDSLLYFKAYINLKKFSFNKAIEFSNQLKDSTILKSKIFAHIAYLALSKKVFNVNLNYKQLYDTTYIEQLKIIALAKLIIEKKYMEFEELYKSTKFKNDMNSLCAYNLWTLSYNYQNTKLKKPFIAGALSAIIPGLGKVYSGKKHEAISVFVPFVISGAQATEGFIKKGFRSWHFYVFGTITTGIYLSNIYGSANAAKRKNKETNEELYINILAFIEPAFREVVKL